MKHFKITRLNHLINDNTSYYWRLCFEQYNLIYPDNITNFHICNIINLKDGDKIYVSKYSSIPSSLFNKLKFNLIQVRKPELADYVIADEPKEWIKHSYDNFSIIEDWNGKKTNLKAHVIKKPYVKKLQYLEKYNCVNTICLLKYLDEHKEKPTQSIIDNICASLKNYNEEDNKLAVDLLKYYDFRNNKIELAFALVKNNIKDFNKIINKYKYLKLLFNIEPSLKYYYKKNNIIILDKLLNFKSLSNEEIEKVRDLVFINYPLVDKCTFIDESEFSYEKHTILINDEAHKLLKLKYVYLRNND